MPPLVFTVIQISNKTVEPAGFRYVMILSGGPYARAKATATVSLFEFFERIGSAISQDQWEEIEQSLAKFGVHKITDIDTDLQKELIRSLQ